MRDRDLVAGLQLTFADDPHVGARAARLRERPDHPEVAEAQPELRARQPWLADLELDGAEPPALADDRAADVDALHRQVLAEHRVGDLDAEYVRPPVRVLARVDVD